MSNNFQKQDLKSVPNNENVYKDEFPQRSQQLKNLLNTQKTTVPQTNYNSQNLQDMTNIINKSKNSMLASQEITSSQSKLNLHVYDLFLETRKKLDEQSILYLRKVVPLEEDREKIIKQDPQQILTHLKSVISYLIKSKQETEEILQKKSESECSDYESMLQKLEAEVRQHIRIEQQLKLYAENTQQKLEDVQKEKDQENLLFSQMQQKYEELKNQLIQQQEQNAQKDKEILQLRKSIKEGQNISMTQLQNSQKFSINEDRIRVAKEHESVNSVQANTNNNYNNNDSEQKRGKRSMTFQQSQDKIQDNSNKIKNEITTQMPIGLGASINAKVESQQQFDKNRMNTEIMHNKEQLKSTSRNLEEKIRKSMDKYKIDKNQEPCDGNLNRKSQKDIKENFNPQNLIDSVQQNVNKIPPQQQSYTHSIQQQPLSNPQTGNYVNPSKNIEKIVQQKSQTIQPNSHYQAQQVQQQYSIPHQTQFGTASQNQMSQQHNQHGLSLQQQSQSQIQAQIQQQQQIKMKSKSKYQEYQTLDSERIKSLSKKLNEIQVCQSSRQQNDSSQVTKRSERAISNYQNSNQVKQQNNISQRPPSSMDIEKEQKTINQKEKEKDSCRSFSVDNHSKSSQYIKGKVDISMSNQNSISSNNPNTQYSAYIKNYNKSNNTNNNSSSNHHHANNNTYQNTSQQQYYNHNQK